MKINFKKYLYFLLIISSSLFVDCKKNPFDARSKFLGTWNFTYSTSSYSAGVTTSSSNVEYLGSVYVDSGDKSHNWIYINFGPSFTIKFKISPSHFSDKAGLDGSPQPFNGRFNSKKSVSLTFNSNSHGSGYTLNDIQGTKK